PPLPATAAGSAAARSAPGHRPLRDRGAAGRGGGAHRRVRGEHGVDAAAPRALRPREDGEGGDSMNDPRWLAEARDQARSALRQALDEERRYRPSDMRRRRVWARMAGSDAARRGTRRAFIAGAAAASALTAAGVLALQHLTGRSAVAPRVVIAPAPVAPAAPVAPPVIAARLVSPPLATPGALSAAGGLTTRRLASGVRVDLQPGAGLFVADDARAEVRRGEVRFDVPPRGASPPFVVRVAAYRVIIAGARFS